MKTIILSVVFMFIFIFSAFCGGNMELVNSKEIDLNNINDVKIVSSSDKISFFMGTSDKLVIKEYMNEDNIRYYANISAFANTVTVESGRRPFRPFFPTFMRRLEVHFPVSYNNAINIKTSSGIIETSDLICSNITIESSSGNISIKSITADTINIKTTSGNIVLNMIAGSVNLKTSSGNVNCAVGEKAGNISIETTSGPVRLNLPPNYQFHFSVRSTSGRLTAPFSDRLSNPVTDRNLTQGIISNNSSENIPAINIITSSGPIRIEWLTSRD